jgi:hypothetical protein
LTLLKDPETFELLAGVLRGSSSLDIPKARAIRYLALDNSKDHYKAIRPLLNDPNEEVQAEAVRALGSDLSSRGEIRALARDPKGPTAVRLAAVDVLAAQDPEFPRYAVDLVAQANENPEVRKSCIGYLNVGLRLKREGYNNGGEIQKVISHAANSDPDEGVKNVAIQADKQLADWNAEPN